MYAYQHFSGFDYCRYYHRSAVLVKSFLKSFFYSEGKPQPVYFWITLLMILTIVMIIMAMVNRLPISDAVFISILGFVGGWIALYNWDKRKNNDGGQS